MEKKKEWSAQQKAQHNNNSNRYPAATQENQLKIPQLYQTATQTNQHSNNNTQNKPNLKPTSNQKSSRKQSKSQL